MEVLFKHVARIGTRGRKYWLGRVVVAPLPKHPAGAVLSFAKNHKIHQITDSCLVDHVRRAISGIDTSAEHGQCAGSRPALGRAHEPDALAAVFDGFDTVPVAIYRIARFSRSNRGASHE